ncbi:unnamed protein product [Rodentolepis nana]|uniref:EF-hand domain-containing protein n=1 Tax=Rodentolepis nana TaxID=102285 RepID=A0A158QHI1_RODNA|nr:unnamed protein product [Rodentolepis nana]
MFLVGQESGRHYLVLKSTDLYKNLPLLASSILTTIFSLWNKHIPTLFSNLWHNFNEILGARSIQTIRFPSERYRNDEVMSRNWIYFYSILVLILFLSNLIPTANAGVLGLGRSQQGSHQLQPQTSPFSDPANTGVESVPSPDDSTIVIRTVPVSVLQPVQPIGLPSMKPYQFLVPPMNPEPQQPAPVPVYYPNYNYYPVYGSRGYPKSQFFGNCGPYNSRRNSQQNRQKNGNRRRKERRKGEKCPKVCDTCIKTHDLKHEREKDELQKRFAFHAKPALQNTNSVEALFKYMDGNNDGSISLTELQNYLLLHNIISPEVPK